MAYGSTPTFVPRKPSAMVCQWIVWLANKTTRPKGGAVAKLKWRVMCLLMRTWTGRMTNTRANKKMARATQEWASRSVAAMESMEKKSDHEPVLCSVVWSQIVAAAVKERKDEIEFETNAVVQAKQQCVRADQSHPRSEPTCQPGCMVAWKPRKRIQFWQCQASITLLLSFQMTTTPYHLVPPYNSYSHIRCNKYA